MSEQSQYHAGIDSVLQALKVHATNCDETQSGISGAEVTLRLLASRFGELARAVSAMEEHYVSKVVPVTEAVNVRAAQVQERFQEALPDVKGKPALERIAAGVAVLVKNADTVSAHVNGSVENINNLHTWTTGDAPVMQPLRDGVAEFGKVPQGLMEQNASLQQQLGFQKTQT